MKHFTHLEDYLTYYAQLTPDKIAVVCNEHILTYSELLCRVNEKKDEIKQYYKENSPFVFLSTQDERFLITYLAIHLAQCIAVPLERNSPDKIMDDIKSRLAGNIFPPETADILFTTGTTGKSKGVMIGHTAIVANGENLIDAMNFTSDLSFIICGPLNHIGSLSKIYPVLMTGGTLIILEGLKKIDAFFNTLKIPSSRFATFMVPSSIHLMLLLASKQLAEYAGKIAFIETGGAAMPQADITVLKKLLPSSKFFLTYASTETGIIATNECFENPDKADSAGKAMKNSSFFITTEGTLACQGKTLMLGYAGDKELTQTILYNDAVHTTDIAEIDPEGYLYIRGRIDDVINIGGYKIAPTEIENAVADFPNLSESICICEKHPILGSVVKLLFVSKNDEKLNIKAIASHLRNKLEEYKIPYMYKQVDSIHKTYNGKIDRKYYRCT